MKNSKFIIHDENRPIAVGTGLIALDIIYNEISPFEPKLRAGGSCGNVMTILSYFGWNTYPIARYNADSSADIVIKDLSQWKVNTENISRKSDGSTPIIVERIKKNRKGNFVHFFYTKCPHCGSFLPRYKPILAKEVPNIIDNIPKPKTFYFDRVSRSSIEIAKKFHEAGSLIFFEPAGVRDEKQFLECLNITDILKYSETSLRDVRDIIEMSNVPLIIETLGENGLRFSQNCQGDKKWKQMNSYPINNIRDTAGAGDWCSAGIIHSIGHEGRDFFNSIKSSDLERALGFGQIIAALNCQFDGARGIMYNIKEKEFTDIVNDILENEKLIPSLIDFNNGDKMQEIARYCPECLKKD